MNGIDEKKLRQSIENMHIAIENAKEQCEIALEEIQKLKAKH